MATDVNESPHRRKIALQGRFEINGGEMTKSRRVSAVMGIVGALVVLGALISGCGSSDDSSSGASSPETSEASSGDTTLAMATQPWIGYGPWWIVEENGYDEANGFTLTLTNFNEDAPMQSAFAADQVQALNISINQALVQMSTGSEMKLVLLEDSSDSADAILAGSEIKSVKELEGKSVAYEEGSTSDVLLRYALSQNGLSMDDISPVQLPAASAGAAVIAGKVDAAVTYEPYISAALSKGDEFHVIYDAGEKPGLISDTLGVNPEFAEENPELISSALKAWNDAIEFYRKNPEEAQAIIARAIGAKPEELTTSFEGIKLFDLEESQDLLSEQFSELAPELEEILEEGGILKSVPEVKSATELSYGEAALEEK